MIAKEKCHMRPLSLRDHAAHRRVAQVTGRVVRAAGELRRVVPPGRAAGQLRHAGSLRRAVGQPSHATRPPRHAGRLSRAAGQLSHATRPPSPLTRPPGGTGRRVSHTIGQAAGVAGQLGPGDGAGGLRRVCHCGSLCGGRVSRVAGRGPAVDPAFRVSLIFGKCFPGLRSG
jgi:hypothetical protein